MAASITAVVVSFVFGTLEVITLFIMFIVPFVAIFGVLSIFLRLPQVAEWPLARQRFVTWLVAASVGVFVGLLPLTIKVLTR